MHVKRKSIGIFALQGSFAEHQKMIEMSGADAFLIRDLPDVDGRKIDGLILPGGESTTISKLLKKTGLGKWLIKQAESGLPIFGTCAGMIVLANLGLIDIDVERNAYGGQLDSFEEEIILESGLLRSPDSSFNGIFIRAPKVRTVGKKAKVLGYHKKTPVFIRQNNVLAASFHPELTDDLRIHKLLLEMKKNVLQ
jgi:pyridoxal 5'-phosphate synthase pdxT subunit